MDILQLPNLNEQFDLIECCGVLHHMRDPLLGLSALLEVLKKDGYMKLGLYSDLARQDVVKARKIISTQNIDSSQEGIRLFRHRLFSGDFPEITKLQQWSDFYTTSMCRDLCFHVQEHRYSINSIANILNTFNLNFLGFILDQPTKKLYSLKYKNDKGQINLKNWVEFEEANPNTFRSMYQFWVNRC